MATYLDQSFGTSGTGDTNTPLRFDATVTAIAQQFIPTQTDVKEVSLSIKKAGSPSGNIWVELWTDSGSNLPSAQTGADTATISAASISTSYSDVLFTFASAITVTPGTKYWITFWGSYALDNNNVIQWERLAAGGYSSGIPASYNGTSWGTGVISTTSDFYFKEYTTIAPTEGGYFFTSY